MEVIRVAPEKPSRTTSGTRTTGWEPLVYKEAWAMQQFCRNYLFKMYFMRKNQTPCVCLTVTAATSYKHISHSFIGMRFILIKYIQICFRCIKKKAHRPVGRAVTHWSLEREVWGSNLGPVKSDTVLPTARHRCDISSKGAVLPGRNDAEMGPAKSLNASA